MTVSVIIPTLNEEKHIADILGDLSSQTEKVYEVIVIDGGSKDNTQAIVKKIRHVTFLSVQKPVGNQRKIGGQKATGDLLIFLDADTRVDTNFVKGVKAYFTNHAVDIACPKYLPVPKTFGLSIFYTIFNTLFFLLQFVKPSGAGSCIVVTKKVFDVTGGFDKSFVFDDIEFIRRASKHRRFRILPISVFVSPRRIQKLGFVKSFMMYLTLSFYFATNQYVRSNSVSYPFGDY